MNGDISYNSNNLQTFDPATNVGIVTNAINHTSIPDKQAELFAKADANGSVIPSINYPAKKINIAGTIIGSTQADLDSRIDSFKAYFNGKNKNLDIVYGASTRRYVATANAISVDRQQHFPVANFAVEFICPQPFGTDTSTTSLISELNHTTATYTATPTVGGSAPYQLPVFTITIDSLTGAGDYIQLTNNNNDQEIMVYGVGFANGDVLVVDCVNREVTLNGTEIDYYGTFFELEPGANSITYTDGFTTRQVDIVADYYKRYL